MTHATLFLQCKQRSDQDVKKSKLKGNNISLRELFLTIQLRPAALLAGIKVVENMKLSRE